MSAASGISGSEQLTQVFSDSFESRNLRFLKVTIWNESLVPSSSISPEGTFEEDLNKLPELLEDNEPTYILARLDGDGVEWLAISYVPDTAKVREKMLYASTRNSLTKTLGSSHFVDTLFATSKADLTPEAYAAHKASAAAPQPMSRAEREMAEIREAERQASGGGANSYQGMRARKAHVGPVGYSWAADAEEAVRALGGGEDSRLVVLSLDQSSETLTLTSNLPVSADQLGASLPTTEPSYAFYAWAHSHANSPRRDIVFIYSCPSSSPVKSRMVYSSGAVSTIMYAKNLFPASNALHSRKIETTDPAEIDEAYLVAHLDLANLSVQGPGAGGDGGGTSSGTGTNRFGEEGRGFARPKGPGRRR